MHPDVKEWEQLFLQGRNRTDVGKKIIEDLGFTERVWNAKKERTRIELHCGEYSPWGEGNTCLLEPPTGSLVTERLLRVPVLTEVLTCMATAWHPDFAVAPEPMTASNPEHVALTTRVRELLDRAGLLARPRPEPATH